MKSTCFGTRGVDAVDESTLVVALEREQLRAERLRLGARHGFDIGKRRAP
jgi:hypothetical protein